VNPLGRFAMWTAFPSSDYYQPSAPPEAIGGRRAFPPRPHLVGRPWTGAAGWFPRSPRTVRRVRWPAMPLRHRHGYAADLHRGLPTGDINQSRSSHPSWRVGTRRDPAL